MASGGRIPSLREGIFESRTFLQEDFHSGVIDQDVDCAVTQSATMDFFAWELADHFVTLIDNVEEFFGIGVVRWHSVGRFTGKGSAGASPHLLADEVC